MTIRIIGGGIIGMATAYHLSVRGERPVVYEIDRAYETASFARSCGGLRSQFSTPGNILMSRYSIEFIKATTDVPFTPNGYLLLFDESRRGDHDQTLALQQDLGASTRSLSPNELHNCFPTCTSGICTGLPDHRQQRGLDRPGGVTRLVPGPMSRRRCGHTLWGLSGRPVCVERYHHYYRGLWTRDIACLPASTSRYRARNTQCFRYKPHARS